MQDVFMIKTVNHTYGEVYVNAPLDRESVDRYLLKVRKQSHVMTFLATHSFFPSLTQIQPQHTYNL